MTKKPCIIGGQIEPNGHREGIHLFTPYNEQFIEALKAHISRFDRQWIAWAKRWWIAKEHADVIEGMVRDRWAEYDVVDPDGVVSTHTRGGKIQQDSLF